MIVINAIVEAKKGKEEELENLLRAMIPQVQEEDGAVIYTLHRSRNSKGKYFFYEKYKDQAAVDYHFSTHYFKELIDKFSNLLETEPIVDIFEEIDGIKLIEHY
jgi:quinol monooxygenase YgiN